MPDTPAPDLARLRREVRAELEQMTRDQMIEDEHNWVRIDQVLSRLDALEAEVVALRDVAAEAKEWQRLHVLMNHGHPSDATFGEGRCVAKLCAAVRKLLALETRKEE